MKLLVLALHETTLKWLLSNITNYVTLQYLEPFNCGQAIRIFKTIQMYEISSHLKMKLHTHTHTHTHTHIYIYIYICVCVCVLI